MSEIKAVCSPSTETCSKIEETAADKAEKRAHHASTGQETVDGEPVKKRWKKKARYAMLLAYQGKNYCGMQIQKDAPTIEGTLLDAMHRYGLITADEMSKPNLFYFQRAARTDRAVSAVRQMCSMMLNFDEDLPKSGAEELNKLLPSDIRVMGIRRATKMFNAQRDCDSRTYSYTLPTYAFAKVDELTNSAYRINDETINEIDKLLAIFVGTHNFYNYTSKREFTDRSCCRYIIDFKCGERFLMKNELRDEDVEFMTVRIKGQSFMLHQIRKMIGMVITISRGLLYKSDIQRSFEATRMDIPKAPGLGLLLEQIHYANYDRKFEKTHEKLNDWGEEIEKRIAKVRQDLIISEIVRQEIASQSMMNWLSDLIKHDFTFFPEDEETPKDSPLALAAGIAAKVKKLATEDGTADRLNDAEKEESGEKKGDADENDERRRGNIEECTKETDTIAETMDSSLKASDESSKIGTDSTEVPTTNNLESNQETTGGQRMSASS